MVIAGEMFEPLGDLFVFFWLHVYRYTTPTDQGAPVHVAMVHAFFSAHFYHYFDGLPSVIGQKFGHAARFLLSASGL